MKCSVLGYTLTVLMVVALLTPATEPRAATDWEVDGYTLNETQQIWLDYIADYVLPPLTTYYGSREQALDSAAVVTWWTLTEGVLGFKQDIHPKNPVSYSNCNGDKTQSATTECTSGAWQIGIGAIQSPTSTSKANAIIPDLEDILLEGYPNSTVEAVLRMVTQHAGYAAGGATENAIVDSSGRVRAAWLNRVGVVSFVQQYPRILNECWDQCKSWCFKSCGRGSWSETDKWAPNRAQAEAAIADLRDLIDELETNADGATVKRSAVADGADFDGDGKDDIFWYAAGSASDHIWYGTGRNTWSRYHDINIYGSYVPITGDFDGDGNSDIFWYAAGSASDWIYYGEGRNGKFRVVSKKVYGTYTPISGDFNGDGRTDIFWYGPGSSSDSIWMATATGFKYYSAAIWGTYKPIAGDFDGDGKDDIFWYAAGSAADWIYYGTADPGNDGFRVVSKSVYGTYTPISGDFNGDGRDDVLWYGPGDSFDALWLAQGSGFKYYAIKVLGTYRPVKGDFDGDGITDIFWYGVGGKVDNMWFGNPDHTFKWMAAKVVNGNYVPLP